MRGLSHKQAPSYCVIVEKFGSDWGSWWKSYTFYQKEDAVRFALRKSGRLFALNPEYEFTFEITEKPTVDQPLNPPKGKKPHAT